MAQLRIRLLVAILAFAIGLFCHVVQHTLRQRSYSVTSGVETIKLPSSTFEATGNFSFSTMSEDYLRPADGAYVQFGCSDRSSIETALRFVRVYRTARIVEKTMVFSDQGTKIGERVVWESDELPTKTGVEWNEGSRLFYISGSSLEAVLTFEESHVWKPTSCWDFTFLNLTPPNNRLQRTRR